MFGFGSNSLKENEVAVDKNELSDLERKASTLDQLLSDNPLNSAQGIVDNAQSAHVSSSRKLSDISRLIVLINMAINMPEPDYHHPDAAFLHPSVASLGCCTAKDLTVLRDLSLRAPDAHDI